MDITGLDEYCYTDASSKKVGTKYSSDTETNMSEVFKKEVLNWKLKIKEKIHEDLENDQEKNIKMSEKQWQALMNRVDISINAHKLDVKVDSSKTEEEDK